MTAAKNKATAHARLSPGLVGRGAACLALWLTIAQAGDVGAKEAGLALVASEQATLSRITLDAPKTLATRIEVGDNSLVLRLPKGAAYDLSALGGRSPRRVAAITALADGLRIVAEPGTRIRHHRIGERIIIEVSDGPGLGVADAGKPSGPVVESGAARSGTPDLRLAALVSTTASDAPATPLAGSAPRTVTRPAAGAPTPGAQSDDGVGPAPLAQLSPQLPPMPAAARNSILPTATRSGPFGATDLQGRPSLSIQAQAPAPGLPQLVQPPLVSPGLPAGQRPPLTPISVVIDSGSGRLLSLPSPAFTIMAADPRVARVQPASPTSIFIMGVAGGRTNIIATAEDGTLVAEFDVVVNPGRAAAAPAMPTTNAPVPSPQQAAPLNAVAIESMIRRMVRGGEGVRVGNLGGRGLTLSGLVPSAAEAQRAEAIAKAYAGEDRPVLNNITLLSSIQVNLRVRVAEVSRNVTRELGFNWTVIARDGAGMMLGLRTGAAASIIDAITGRTTAGSSDPGRYAVSYSSSRFDINSVIDALAGDQLISILAEPNLTAQSGEPASFLAGGEFPVPVSASAVTGAIGIEFKQFGVSLGFVPTVLSPERLNLRVRPEVSELSDNGAISLPLANGVVRIPALSVRRAETTIELGSGQSFAIAGLLQRTNVVNNSGIIGLGDLPVIGALFRSDRFRRNETELVIIITPYLVRPVSDGQALATPNEGFRAATDLDRIIYRRQMARGATPSQPRLPADAGFIVE